MYLFLLLLYLYFIYNNISIKLNYIIIFTFKFLNLPRLFIIGFLFIYFSIIVKHHIYNLILSIFLILIINYLSFLYKFY